MHIMAKLAFLVLIFTLLPAEAQSPIVSLGGVQLRLGMEKNDILATYSQVAGLKLMKRPGNERQFVLMAGKNVDDLWTKLGELVFDPSGRLAQISVTHHQVVSNPGVVTTGAVTFAKSLYTAVRLAGEGSPVDVRTTSGDDANNPWYRVQLIYRDRELVIWTSESNGIQSASVETFFPALITSPQPGPAK